jgi:hypothetical protein
MHSAYGYYGLYIYLRKELRFFGGVRRKSYFEGQIARALVFLTFHSRGFVSGLYCPGELK